jgi:hypothetical protein
MSDVLSVWIAAILTLMVYSYLLGDNPVYRLAQHLFVGSSVGYAVVIVIYDVLGPRLATPLLRDPRANWPYLLPLLLGLLLLSKGRAGLAWLGNSSMAFLFGVGAALAIGGALVASFLPQIQASWVPISPTKAGGVASAMNNALLAVGTIGTLSYFYFTMGVRKGPERRLVRVGSIVGKWVILVTFGAFFANRVMAYLSLLVERAYFLLGDWLGLLG